MRCRNRCAGGNSRLRASCRDTDATALVDAEHLMVPSDHFARGTRLAVVEQDEVLDNV